jgi:hypothetical protein
MSLQQNGTFYPMHEDYYINANKGTLLPTCLAPFWPPKHYHLKQSFFIPFFLKRMAKQRLSTKSWFMLFELTLGATNNRTITCTFYNISTTRQHILLHAFHLLKSDWDSNQHLQPSSHSLGLLKVPSINGRNNFQPNDFSNKFHNATV